ncbi:MAG: hypothetical protein IOD12_13930 [Silvanigrellales bacterium]|nr:hypothetical protein [Silvanigrellales bacterium]
MAPLRRLGLSLAFAAFGLFGSLASCTTPRALAQNSLDANYEALATAESLRTQVASQIQLVASGLLDELIFQWSEAPPFEAATPLVVGGLSVPYGLGTGLSSLLENHLFTLLLGNPRAHLTPVHCPACTSLFVVASPSGTTLGRGLETPEKISDLAAASGVRHALFLDFEAEGASLVLRAKITGLQKGLPIVAAKTISTSSSSPALLRDARPLRSAADARKEYLDLLAGRDRFFFPLRAITRIYAAASGAATVAPFVWFEVGAESFFTQEQLWGGGVSLGITSLRGLHEGWSANARLMRLVSGRTRSLTRPDVYLFAGGGVLDIRGENARPFQRSPSSQADLVRELDGKEPRASVATWRLGAEVRIKNRFSAGLFGEAVPSAPTARIGSYVDLGVLSIRCAGLEVGLWF